MAALALTASAVTAVPLAAQSADRWQSGSSNWDRDAFWRGAPDATQQRIDWLERRIDRGIADGSLDREEARRARYQLDTLRRDADALDARLDSLGRNLRWARRDGDRDYGYGDRDPYTTDYDASRYYRDDPRYTERRLGSNDEVYRGSDGRYYCKRSDGTTGLIVGGVGGALLGNVIDGGRHRTGGTLIGGALGALLGRSVDQNQTDVRCR
ncbi:glycine zipper 2TM domain-containing protein [Novosphingobium sp. Gsoil 351]|uniref:glycine zipper 2TM domain-containing protein n=1 Tax=Novosphingobium sp. Gsoil 351 TaxID=2675225 RepID=UPI001E517C74|nr:glycine zipper 2TM domain-containing protein [Novosphingobium sp. Gsoil 351]